MVSRRGRLVYKVIKMADTIYTIANRWNQDFFSTAITSPVNASLLGLTVIDFDKALRKRKTSISTKDLLIPFQYIEEIPGWQKAANYTDYGDVIGRFEPITMYSNSALQEISINIIYHAEARYNVGAKTPWTLENIEKYQKRLQALMFPMYSKGYSSPPKLKLNIANMFVNVPVYVKSVDVKNEAPYDIVTGLSMTRKIALAMSVAYPMWQALSCENIYVEKAGNAIFAYQEADPRKLGRGTSQLTREQRVAQARSYLNRA